MGKIIQTAGRNALGEFAPEFAHFNDDVLFGENWILQRKCGRQVKEICHTKRKQCGHMQKRWYSQSVHQMMALRNIFLAEVFLHRSQLLRLEFSM